MNWIEGLSKLDLKANKYSQYGEELIIKSVFDNIGFTNKYFIDIGAGGAGRNLSNTKLLTISGWTGLSFDMDGSEGTITEFITPNNICQILKNNICPNEFDFLSVDIDSFDYDVIDNVLKEYRPRLVCAEFNGTLDPKSSVKLQYEEGYTWDSTNKYGFSFGAGVKLFAKHGYTVIFNCKETNIFAVKSSLLPDKVAPVTAAQCMYHPINKEAIFINV